MQTYQRTHLSGSYNVLEKPLIELHDSKKGEIKEDHIDISSTRIRNWIL